MSIAMTRSCARTGDLLTAVIAALPNTTSSPDVHIHTRYIEHARKSTQAEALTAHDRIMLSWLEDLGSPEGGTACPQDDLLGSPTCRGARIGLARAEHAPDPTPASHSPMLTERRNVRMSEPPRPASPELGAPQQERSSTVSAKLVLTACRRVPFNLTAVLEVTSDRSERQLDILAGMADGLTNIEIGRGLFVSVNTIKSQARELFLAIAAIDRAHAVKIGFVSGWIG